MVEGRVVCPVYRVHIRVACDQPADKHEQGPERIQPNNVWANDFFVRDVGVLGWPGSRQVALDCGRDRQPDDGSHLWVQIGKQYGISSLLLEHHRRCYFNNVNSALVERKPSSRG